MSKSVLLTGAGFTANFGGFLAKEMWSKIFNHPSLENIQSLKQELKKDFNYENLTSNIRNSPDRFSPEEKRSFQIALQDAYLLMDEQIMSPECFASSGIHQPSLKKLLDHYTQSEGNFCFTLNQDLFMERHYGWQPLGPSSMRYMGNFGAINLKEVNARKSIKLPNQEELDDFKNSTYSSFPAYIKLHGSLKWISDDGTDTQVIGLNKLETINSIPLLKWYFELFEKSLFQHNTKLLVIGYSFNDEHINTLITKAVQEYNLKIYLITTEDPKDFYFRMHFKYPRGTLINEEDNTKRAIWDGISGFFPYKLRDIFPYPQRYSSQQREVFQAINIE